MVCSGYHMLLFSRSVVSDSLRPHGLHVACQASLSITSSQNLLRFMSIESMMPSNHLILCLPLLPPSIFPSIKVFSNESVFCIRWPKYWMFVSLQIHTQNLNAPCGGIRRWGL